MEGTNYTPVDQSRLELLWKKKGRSLRMEIAFVFIGILTVLVAGVIVVSLTNRTKQAKQPQTPAKKVSPTSQPSDTPSPTEQPATPTPESILDASGSALPSNTTIVPPAEGMDMPQDASSAAGM